MKIKGIDLYKKCLNGDKSILDKRFKSKECGEIIVCEITDTVFGMFHVKGCRKNVLEDKQSYSINEIMLSEWEEIEEPVTFLDVIRADAKGKTVSVKHEGMAISYQKWYFGPLLVELSEKLKSEEKLLELIKNGEWEITNREVK